MDNDKPMDNYEGTLETGRPAGPEQGLTHCVEEYTAAVPSSAYLGLALGAMALSLAFQASGRGKWGIFIGQWVPVLLIAGVYNKLVKLDEPRANRGYNG